MAETVTAMASSVDDKLYLIRYRVDDRSHLFVSDRQPCLEKCGSKGRPCTVVCPAHVYRWEEEQGEKRIVVEYERCVECGACRIVCPHGNIDWHYPRGGFGIVYRFG
ncbi:MAG: 4Fe-4S dicluster domain-containing protein [Bacillota bacterium]